MGTLLSRRRYMGGGGGSLPYDAEVEFLESTGTQYIELSFGFYKTDEVYAKFSIDRADIADDRYIVAPKTWNNNSNRFGMGCMSGAFCFAYGNVITKDTLLQPTTSYDVYMHEWEYKNYVCKVKDLDIQLDVSNITFGNETANLKLFYGYNANCKGRISAYKHVKNGVTVVDLIPVRVGTTGYMYDKVSGELLGNDGTGSFVVGADKAGYDIHDYVSDGLIAWYDGEWNEDIGVHNSSATKWVNLADNGNDITGIDNTFTWGDKYLLPPVAGSAGVIPSFAPQTIEAVLIFSGQDMFPVITFENPPGLWIAIRVNNTVNFYSGCVSSLVSRDVLLSISAPGVYNGSSKQYPSEIYIDGIARTKQGGASLGSWTENVFNSATSYGSGTAYWYCLRLYNRVLTREEIYKNYKIDKQRFGLL